MAVTDPGEGAPRAANPLVFELGASGAFAFLRGRHAGPIAAAIAELRVEPGARRVSREVVP